LDGSDRVRIHEKTHDYELPDVPTWEGTKCEIYEVPDLPTGTIEDCEICIKNIRAWHRCQSDRRKL
jgi:hypothetical protein